MITLMWEESGKHLSIGDELRAISRFPKRWLLVTSEGTGDVGGIMKIFCTSSVSEYNSADKQIRYVKNLTPKTPHTISLDDMEALQSSL
jgi:hypothetical protein